MLSQSLHDQELALQAAKSGLDYAAHRLQSNFGWRGDGTAGNSYEVVTLAAGTLVVEEDHGDVVGYLTGLNGELSQFRIRFNWHDGAGGGDGLDDPGQALSTPYVSANNLQGMGPLSVYRADPGTYQVTSTSATHYQVPAGMVCVLVEGRAGNGLRGQGPGNPDPTGSNRTVTPRVVEAYLTPAGATTTDAVAYSGQNMTANLADGAQLTVNSINDASISRVRSNGVVSVLSALNSARYFSPAGLGEIASNGFVAPGGNVNSTPLVPSNGQVLPVSWADIQKATPSDATVRGGTYVWRRDAGGGYLEYYDVAYDPATMPVIDTAFPAGAGTRITDETGFLASGSGAVDFSGKDTFSLTIRDNLFVADSSTGVRSLAIVPSEDLIDNLNVRPATQLIPPVGSSESPILTANDDISLVGRVNGQGSVSSTGDITVQGTSAMEAAPNQGVALYARGDINLQAVPDAVAGALGSLGGGYSANYLGSKNPQWDAWVITTPPPHSGKVYYEVKASGAPPVFPNSYQMKRITSDKTLKKYTSSEPTLPPSGIVGNPPNWAVNLAHNPNPPAAGMGQHQNLKGVLYAQGDIVADLRGATMQGNLLFQGVMVAFGGDPSSQGPGTVKGNIIINANSAHLSFDPSYMAGLAGGAGPLARVLYATRR